MRHNDSHESEEYLEESVPGEKFFRRMGISFIEHEAEELALIQSCCG